MKQVGKGLLDGGIGAFLIIVIFLNYLTDGALLVLGSHDHNIYMYSVLDDGQVYRKAGQLQVGIIKM